MKQLLFAVFLLLTATACSRKPVTEPTPEKGDKPFETPRGASAGELIQITIGAEGGRLQYPDGRLTIVVPAGAVSGPTLFSVEPVESTTPGGKGLAYRLLPHGKEFAKPVTLIFGYENDFPDRVSTATIGMAYQHDKGYWLAQPGVRINTQDKTAAVDTRHFSDWSIFATHELYPNYVVANPGEKIIFWMMEYIDRPGDLAAGKEVPVNQPRKYGDQVTGWHLNGQGTLEHWKDSAAYKAPGIANIAEGMSEVSAEATIGNSKLMLISYVDLVTEGLHFNFGSKWYHFPDISQWSPGYISSEDENTGSVSLEIRGRTDVRKGTYFWQSNEPATQFYFQPAGQNEVTYTSQYATGINLPMADSDGYVEIEHFGPKDDFVRGRFILTSAGKFDAGNNSNTTVKIEGVFRIKRW